MDKESIIGNFESCLYYHEMGADKLDKSNIVSSNLQGDYKVKAKEMEFTNSLNLKVKLKGMDIPFSFAKDDRIDDNKMLKILDKFKDDMNFNNRPYILYKHTDKEHPHYHLVVTNTDYNGNTNEELRGFYRRKVTLLAREYEKEFGLKQLSEISSRKNSKSLKEVNAAKYETFNALKKALKENYISISNDLDVSKPISKEQLKKILGDNFNPVMSKLYSSGYLVINNKGKLIAELDTVLAQIKKEGRGVDDFFSILQKKGIYVRELKRVTPQLITYGIKENDKVVYFSSKDLPKRFSYAELLNDKKNNFPIDKQRSFLINTLKKARNNSIDYNEFKYNLQKHNVTIDEMSNPEFGVYGLKYSSVKANNPHVFTSSELGRDFSYSNLNKHFSGEREEAVLNITKEQNIKSKTGEIKSGNNTTSSSLDLDEGSGVTRKEKVGKFDDKKKGRDI